jgi:hypothetical protein
LSSSLDDVDSQTNRHIDTHTQLKEIKSRHEQELTVLYEYEANALHQDMLSTAASMEYADWPYMHPEDCELTEVSKLYYLILAHVYLLSTRSYRR